MDASSGSNPSPGSGPKPNPVAEFLTRLQRLEENQSFAEFAGDQLRGEIAELSKRLEEIARRTAVLEGRLEALAAGGDEESEPEVPSGD